MMEYFGVRTRHFVVNPATGERREPELGTTEMSARAGELAMAAAGVTAADIDLLITNSSTPDTRLPPLTHSVQRRLGLKSVQVLDLRGGCAAGVQVLALARMFVAAGMSRCALVCSAECTSPYYYSLLLDKRRRERAELLNGLLFADGAGACVVTSENPQKAGFRLGYVRSQSSFSDRDLGYELHGREGFVTTRHNHKAIRRTLPDVVSAAFKDLHTGSIHNGATFDTVLVPQVNRSMIDMVVAEPDTETGGPSKFQLPNAFYIGEEIGNVPAAALPMALDIAVHRGVVRPGQSRVGMIALETTSWAYAVAELNS